MTARGGNGLVRATVPISGGREAILILGRDFALDADLAARLERLLGEDAVAAVGAGRPEAGAGRLPNASVGRSRHHEAGLVRDPVIRLVVLTRRQFADSSCGKTSFFLHPAHGPATELRKSRTVSIQAGSFAPYLLEPVEKFLHLAMIVLEMLGVGDLSLASRSAG